MKLIDFDKKGNLVRFYLGDDDCTDYWGDDWDDAPYEHNAGEVYDSFVTGTMDVAFPFDYEVLEPGDGCSNSMYCKADMKERRVSCILVNTDTECYYDDNFIKVCGSDNNKVAKFYFGDTINEIEKKIDSVHGVVINRKSGSEDEKV